MSGGGGGGDRQLDQTPTWAVAAVCAVIILISIVLEKFLHRLGEWFTQKRKTALFEALEKVKSELMILGFISLLLTFGQSYISRICIVEKAADIMLPCAVTKTEVVKETGDAQHKRLQWEEVLVSLSLQRRMLAAGSLPYKCPQGKVPLVSTEGIHQLHIFIFFLAVFHVACSAMIMALGRLKIRRWKEWEKETLSPDYEFSNDPSRFRFSHDTTFVKAHTSWWTRVTILFYLMSFFRQFFISVRKTDYLTMRHGFIAVHLSPGSKFDFQKYIKRSLEDDFKVVVSISPLLWASAVIFLLLNVRGWQTMFWVSIIPVIIILAVGAKLQAIIAKMALEIKEQHAVIQGMPLVQPGDNHFWFGSPRLVLFLIHFTLFQNAFEIIYFLWIWYEFGLRSCFHKNLRLIIARVILGAGMLFLCSYITLPLYALVSQMGSQMKKSIFDQQTARALKNWHMAAKKKQGARSPNRKLGQSPGVSPGVSPRASPSPGVSPRASPALSLQRFKTTGHLSGPNSISTRQHYSDQDTSDVEMDDMSPISQSAILVANSSNSHQNSGDASSPRHEHVDQEDFSFAKAALIARN